MCAVEQPVSVRTPRRVAPSESTYWTGSRASCGTVNGHQQVIDREAAL